MKQCISTSCMNNVIGNTWHGEVPNNPDDHKDQISGIRGTEKSIAISDQLLYINLQHVLLYLPNNASKDVRYRKPKKNTNVPCYPYRERVLKSIKNGKAKNH